MKERPILFSGAMVRAILHGSKTQTRRVIRRPFAFGNNQILSLPGLKPVHCPYGNPGTRIWVRESFCVGWLDDGKVLYRANGGLAKDAGYPEEPKWKPSIFMPRWASRITLEITDVRVQRLQEISVDDALAEGIQGKEWCPTREHEQCRFEPDWHFKNLWDSINGKRGCGWSTNPWVWAISFKRIQQQEKAA